MLHIRQNSTILPVTVAQSIPKIPGLRGSQSVIVHVIRDPNYCPLYSLSAVSLPQPYFIRCLSVALKGACRKNLFYRFSFEYFGIRNCIFLNTILCYHFIRRRRIEQTLRKEGTQSSSKVRESIATLPPLPRR